MEINQKKTTFVVQDQHGESETMGILLYLWNSNQHKWFDKNLSNVPTEDIMQLVKGDDEELQFIKNCMQGTNAEFIVMADYEKVNNGGKPSQNDVVDDSPQYGGEISFYIIGYKSGDVHSRGWITFRATDNKWVRGDSDQEKIDIDLEYDRKDNHDGDVIYIELKDKANNS